MPQDEELKRCLIADDVRASREILRAWLCQCRFECTVTSNGEEAWKAIHENPPDLLVTDIEMPDCSGLELLQRIRHHTSPRIKSIPVLVVTSLHDGQMREAVQRLGGNGLLVKPLDKGSTFSVVLEVLVAGLKPGELVVSETHDCSPRDGLVSPTLRRLLQTVAANEERRK